MHRFLDDTLGRPASPVMLRADPSVHAIKLRADDYSARKQLREAALVLVGKIIRYPFGGRLLPLRAVARLRTNRPVMPPLRPLPRTSRGISVGLERKAVIRSRHS